MTPTLRAFFSLAALSALVACGRGNPPPQPSGPPPLAPFPAAVRIYYDNSGGLADSLRSVIRDQQDFQRVWAQATSRQSSPPPPPTVDFSLDMVLVTGAGRLTTDDQVRVDSVALSREMNEAGAVEERLNVFVSVILACQRFDIAGYPLEIVRLRRFDGPIRFHDRRRQAEGCPPPPGVEATALFR